MTNYSLLFFISLLLITRVSVVSGARILCLFHVPSVSHQATFQPISKELSLRGHEVIAITPSPLKDKLLTNLTEIDISYTHEILIRHGFQFFMSREVSIHTKIQKIFTYYYEQATAIFENEDFKKIYKNPNQKFDLIISQVYISPILLAISAKLKAPIIGVSSMGAWSGSQVAIGNPNPPSLYSEMFLPYNGKLSFWERVKSTVYFLWTRYYIYFVAMPESDAIVKKYLGSDLPYLADIEKNLSALFLNINPIFYAPRPMVPTVIPLGFMHIKNAKPLPQDIKDEIESSVNGVVYFSLGSNVKSINIPDGVRNVLIKAFAELPYKVLWKFEGDMLPGQPKNVIIRKWMPQQDILAHRNVKVFISQCGLQSTEEAIDREIPMVGIPFIADQEQMLKKLIEQGVALGIDYLNTTKEELVRTITEVATNPIYRKNMKRLRQLLQDEPMTGLERAIWWAEYVIRHKGASHLRSPTVDIEWYKYLLLDVIAFLLGSSIFGLLVLIKSAKFIICRSFQKSRKFKKL